MGTIRLILAISVVIAHSTDIFGFRLVGGQLAVQTFYIISGFYMALILKEKYIGANGSYKLFISNRFLRIYPVYWVILIATVLVSLAAYLYSGSGFFHIYAEYFDSMSIGSILFLIFTNIVLFFQDTVLFLGLDVSSGNLFFTSDFAASDPALCDFLFVPQAWTVALELTFYLIAPFIVKKRIRYLIGMIVVLLILRFIISYGFGLNYDPWTHRFFPTELVFFIFGIIAYHIYKRIAAVEIKKVYLNSIWIGFLAITFAFSFLPLEYDIKRIAYLSIFFMALPFIFILTKSWRFDRNIGELSYLVYISHTFVLICMRPFKFLYADGAYGISLVVLTLLCSVLLNELVSKKIEQMRQKRVKKAEVYASN